MRGRHGLMARPVMERLSWRGWQDWHGMEGEAGPDRAGVARLAEVLPG